MVSTELFDLTGKVAPLTGTAFLDAIRARMPFSVTPADLPP